MMRVLKSRALLAVPLFALSLAVTGCATVPAPASVSSSNDSFGSGAHFYDPPAWNTLDLINMETELV